MWENSRYQQTKKYYQKVKEYCNRWWQVYGYSTVEISSPDLIKKEAEVFFGMFFTQEQ